MAAAEEEDEEIWDSWEDVADSGELERRMEERSKQQWELDKKLFDTNTKAPVVLQEETNRTQYKPQLRILKRPGSETAAQNRKGSAVVEKPVHKTLAERERQYAEARARILGSASDGSTDSTPEPSSNPRPLKLEDKLPDNVVRQPKGPDGTNGFKVKR